MNGYMHKTYVFLYEIVTEVKLREFVLKMKCEQTNNSSTRSNTNTVM